MQTIFHRTSEFVNFWKVWSSWVKVVVLQIAETDVLFKVKVMQLSALNLILEWLRPQTLEDCIFSSIGEAVKADSRFQ